CAAVLGDSAAEIRRSYNEALDKFVRKILSDEYSDFGVALSETLGERRGVMGDENLSPNAAKPPLAARTRTTRIRLWVTVIAGVAILFNSAMSLLGLNPLREQYQTGDRRAAVPRVIDKTADHHTEVPRVNQQEQEYQTGDRRAAVPRANQREQAGNFWDGSGRCFAVEDICLDRQGGRWVYFGDDKKDSTLQPSISLDFFLIENENPSDDIDTSNIHFDVSPIYKRKLEDLQQQFKCEMSRLENHIVLQAAYNEMLGEFYARSFAPLVELIPEEQVAPLSSQYYIHFGTSATLLASHILFLSLLTSQSKAKNFREMFLPDDNIGCECFPRLVFCGYEQSQPDANTTCLSRFGSFHADHPRISSELCDFGLGLDIMQSVVGNEGREGLRELLREVFNGRLFEVKGEIMQFLDKQPGNLAIGADFVASSEDALYPAKNAFDGNLMTRWSSFATDSEYIQVDLGGFFNVKTVIVRWEYAAAKQYEIQVSSDGKYFETVWAELNGFPEMGAVESTFNGTECRFVRLQGIQRATEWGYSLYEMEVHGTSSKKEKERGLTHSTNWSDLSEHVTLDLALGLEGDLSYSSRPGKFSKARAYILRNLGLVFPNLKRDVAEYRRTYFNVGENWKLLGLTQRLKRRSWLNLDAIMEHCNRKYNSMNILCVEVNVEKLPSGGGDLDPSYEQVLLHQSLAGLIGIHGAQLTQGLLLPENSTLVELLPWVPINYFPSGHDGWGVWTQLSNEPTPVGIMFHNTDLHHYGFKLGRDSVPLCQNVSNIKMHKFEEEDDLPDNHEAVTELEHCLYTLHDEEFRWDERNFVVGKEMIDGLMTLYPGSTQLTNVTCDVLKQSGKRRGFVLYNTWCREKPGSAFTLHHFYSRYRRSKNAN
ncbi:hypothetical protein THAOC_08925, partial [Thalassiosira oceanica]